MMQVSEALLHLSSIQLSRAKWDGCHGNHWIKVVFFPFCPFVTFLLSCLLCSPSWPRRRSGSQWQPWWRNGQRRTCSTAPLLAGVFYCSLSCAPHSLSTKQWAGLKRSRKNHGNPCLHVYRLQTNLQSAKSRYKFEKRKRRNEALLMVQILPGRYGIFETTAIFTWHCHARGTVQRILDAGRTLGIFGVPYRLVSVHCSFGWSDS